jgi:hypothetical protein
MIDIRCKGKDTDGIERVGYYWKDVVGREFIHVVDRPYECDFEIETPELLQPPQREIVPSPPRQVETRVSQRAKLFKADSEYVIEYLHQGFIDWAHTNVPECQGDGAQEVLDATIQIIKDGASG